MCIYNFIFFAWKINYSFQSIISSHNSFYDLLVNIFLNSLLLLLLYIQPLHDRLKTNPIPWSPILSSSNTSNYILITLNQHILHASFTRLSTLKIGDNLYINLSPTPIHFRTNPQDFNTSYTYWDYQQAWFNAFLLQNQNHSHSWLFYFYSVMNTTNLPPMVPPMVGLLWLSC